MGLGVFLYPLIYGSYKDAGLREDAYSFLKHNEPNQPVPDSSKNDREDTRIHRMLWSKMVEYNAAIYQDGQQGLDGRSSYEKPAFYLSDFGLESEIIAVISIPKLELTMPVYLGANSEHIAAGAAVLGQTSLPIGGKNTNCVIAGHRGWNGASYFRDVPELTVGDRIIITNLWERLEYQVCETKIIKPNAIEEILIQPNRDLVTLLTCHPYGSGGRQRFLVICERVN